MQSVDKKLKKLFKQLMKLPELAEFHLVGGTNLALRYNHRHSVDIDLFRTHDYDLNSSQDLNRQLSNIYGDDMITTSVSNVGIFSLIRGIKVDIVNDPHALLKPLDQIFDGRLASTLDIAAMKINAIAGRGTKKDFYDLYELMKSFPLFDMIEAYKTKYKIDMSFHAVKSLTFFGDTDTKGPSNTILWTREKPTWDEIKTSIENAVIDMNLI